MRLQSANINVLCLPSNSDYQITILSSSSKDKSIKSDQHHKWKAAGIQSATMVGVQVRKGVEKWTLVCLFI